jgi:NADH-quinone oxidoreductase subunit G
VGPADRPVRLRALQRRLQHHPGERYGELRRILNRYNREVNGYFLCDRGRYGYEFVNELVGYVLRILHDGPVRSASLEDVRTSDAVLVLGEDLTNSAPVLGLAVRQAARVQPARAAAALRIPEWDDNATRELIQGRTGPVFIATPAPTKLDEVAAQVYRAAPDDIARLGFAIAGALGAPVPPLADLAGKVRDLVGTLAETLGAETPVLGGLDPALRDLAVSIADALRSAERPLVIAGTSCGSAGILQAAANVAWALQAAGRPAQLSLVVPESNSLGLAMMGGGSLSDAFAAAREGRASTVVILENDLYRRTSAGAAARFLKSARHVVVIDHLLNATSAQAEVILPASTFVEGDGTLVNQEGRAQRFYQVFVPKGEDVQEGWRWLKDMMLAGSEESRRASEVAPSPLPGAKRGAAALGLKEGDGLALVLSGRRRDLDLVERRCWPSGRTATAPTGSGRSACCRWWPT